MRSIVVLFWMLLGSTLSAQFEYAQPQQVIIEGPKATIVTAVGCRACPAAKALLTPWLQRGKWTVDVDEHKSMQAGKLYPFVRLCWDGKCVEVQLDQGESVTLVNFERRMRAALGYPVQVMRNVRKRWSQNEGHYTPSVRGMSIEFHLTEHHGIDVTGMTVQQMEAAHQAAHR